MKELRTKSSPDIKIFLIGNKADLEDKRVVSYEQGEKKKEEYGFDLFLETSAKTGLNAQKLFFEAGKILEAEHTQLKEKRKASKVRLKSDADKISKEKGKKEKKSWC